MNNFDLGLHLLKTFVIIVGCICWAFENICWTSCYIVKNCSLPFDSDWKSHFPSYKHKHLWRFAVHLKPRCQIVFDVWMIVSEGHIFQVIHHKIESFEMHTILAPTHSSWQNMESFYFNPFLEQMLIFGKKCGIYFDFCIQKVSRFVEYPHPPIWGRKFFKLFLKFYILAFTLRF